MDKTQKQNICWQNQVAEKYIMYNSILYKNKQHIVGTKRM